MSVADARLLLDLEKTLARGMHALQGAVIQFFKRI
jgi:hypothetical protein